ncbi:MAG: acyl-CoA dehydrogenase family protein [Syntrophobacteraceae bacterium]|nr:acyl-CoA dehydrogenase family protein [Desulfobacteraceae bacterium]
METATFIEKIYRGSLDARVPASFKILRDTRKVAGHLAAFTAVLRDYPAAAIEEEGRIPAEMLQRMGAVGLFGMTIPESYGGLGFNLWEYLQVVEELARLDISAGLVSLAHLSIGVKGIVLFGNESQKTRYLPPAASGKTIFAFALTEPLIGSDAQHIETAARLSKDGSHYILNGRKTYITNANYAGGVTVFAQLDPKRPGFMGAFIVETDREGVRIGKDMPKMGLKASSTAAIHFKDVRVPVENLLGRPGDGFKIAMTILNYGRLGLGAASAGMMRQSFEDMMKRSSTRIQFSVPIRDFPLVQEKIVRARVYSFISSAMNDFVAGLLEASPRKNAAIETSHCKLFGTTHGWDAVYDALQVAGGAGYLSTQPYEKRMRDFRVTTVFEGTTEIHSIYPPLFALRKLAAQQRAHGKGIRGIVFLLRELFRRTDWPLYFDHPVLEKASRVARANAASIRKMLCLGLLLYGRKVSEKEFFLRRITTLSVHMLGILAALSRMEADRKAGALSADDVGMLRYFALEAAEARRKNRTVFDSRIEKLNGETFEAMCRSWTKARG